mmetsp:Transcript_22580/g.70792  ORF Transcript_22580/g.70792 Transcript_22580/m.70792 type:complete len:353 (+) Transcript_22580:145-1203(+)
MNACRVAIAALALASSAAGDDDDAALWGDTEVKRTDFPHLDPETQELVAKVQREAAAKQAIIDNPELKGMIDKVMRGSKPPKAGGGDPQMAEMMAKLKQGNDVSPEAAATMLNKDEGKPGPNMDDVGGEGWSTMNMPAMPGQDAPLPPLDRCDACFVVWQSLADVLRLESKLFKDQTSVLQGGRLDGNGRRKGTSHDYKTSETRTTRVLGRVCDLAGAYRYNDQGNYWVKNRTLAAWFEEGRALPVLGRAKSNREELRMKLTTYCGETLEDQEEALAKFVVEDGVDDDGRQAFCGGVVKDCRESAFEEYAKRQSISNLLSGIDDPGDPMHKPKPEMRKKKRKRKKKAAADEL